MIPEPTVPMPQEGLYVFQNDHFLPVRLSPDGGGLLIDEERDKAMHYPAAQVSAGPRLRGVVEGVITEAGQARTFSIRLNEPGDAPADWYHLRNVEVVVDEEPHHIDKGDAQPTEAPAGSFDAVHAQLRTTLNDIVVVLDDARDTQPKKAAKAAKLAAMWQRLNDLEDSVGQLQEELFEEVNGNGEPTIGNRLRSVEVRAHIHGQEGHGPAIGPWYLPAEPVGAPLQNWTEDGNG